MQGHRTKRINDLKASTANAAKSARASVPSLITDDNARAPPDAIRLIYKPELLRLIGVSYSSIFAWMRAGKFPLAREIGPGGRSTRIAWLESEVHAWLASRPKRQIKPNPERSRPRGRPRKADQLGAEA
jgi:predicted DNA-binding transcriptional regulator AlpA